MNIDTSYYYSMIFPSAELSKWFPSIKDRLIRYMVEGGDWRNLHITSQNSFKSTVVTLSSKIQRMDIGSVLSGREKNAQSNEAGTSSTVDVYTKYSWRELVFDCDLSDYDNIREKHCACSGKKTCCDSCWVLAYVAMKCIEYVIHSECGYSDYFVVFSGRRGAHFWVHDKNACKLSAKTRSALIKRITSVADAPDSSPIRKEFTKIVTENVPLEWLEACPDVTLFFPRLDVDVTTKMEHLIKIPFSIHPDTSNISIPMTVDATKTFLPSDAPNLKNPALSEMISYGLSCMNKAKSK